jgi:hypothetical protein
MPASNVRLVAEASNKLPAVALAIAFFHRVWPVAGLAFGLIVTVVWTALLGYGLIELIELAL